MDNPSLPGMRVATVCRLMRCRRRRGDRVVRLSPHAANNAAKLSAGRQAPRRLLSRRVRKGFSLKRAEQVRLPDMAIVAQGVDLVHIPRVERMWRDHGERLLARVLTAAEAEYCLKCKTPVVRLAGRLAAKEAVMKMLGTGWRGGIEWTEIETLPDPLGKPLVSLSGRTAQLAATLGIEQVLISITHSGEYALATALGLRAVGDGASR